MRSRAHSRGQVIERFGYHHFRDAVIELIGRNVDVPIATNHRKVAVMKPTQGNLGEALLN